jgi:hypothetical protein
MMRRPNSEAGSVTAELAMALPSVTLVIAITLGGFGLQVERMKLVSISATAARALGRGEAEADVTFNVRAVEPFARLKVVHLENDICAEITKTIRVAALPQIDVSERQCFRKAGL